MEAYNYYKDPTNNFSQDLDEFIHKKSKLAIWVVSNCRAKARNKLAEELANFGVKIDIFGHCFNAPFISKKKMEENIRQYKFYFAFENRQNCRDYITEKFFKNSLYYGAVPVVFGATKEDYEKVAPPGSFIYANDFSAGELAAHLIYLHHNDTSYKKYHLWRTLSLEDMPLYGQSTKWCQLCQVLNSVPSDPNQVTSSKVIPSLKHWLYDSENRMCLN